MGVGLVTVLALAAVASAAYGLKFVFRETKARFHYFWFVLAIVLVAPALLVAAGVWGSVPAVLRWTVGLLLLFFVIFELAFSMIIARHFNDRAKPGLDYVVVLGTRVLDGGPGRVFARRLDAARAYLDENPQTRAVVCGGQGLDETHSEARVGRDYLIGRGIAADRIVLEPRSRSTAENLRFAAELIDPARDTVGIVTSDFHMARSLFLARKLGVEHACGIAVKSPERLPMNSIVRESFAWIKDVFAG